MENNMPVENAMPGRPGEEISKDQTIKTLTQQLNDMKLKAAPWVVNFDVETEQTPDGSYQVVITGKTSAGRGVRQTVSEADLQYAAADQEAFIKHTAEKFVMALINEPALAALRPQLGKALNAVVKLTTRSSL